MRSSKISSPEFVVLNLQDLLDKENGSLAEQILNQYHCPLDSDIEMFAKNNAINFSKQAIARTHLVFRENASQLVGIIALTQKSLSIPDACLSGKPRRLLQRFGKFDERSREYSIPLTLIAQLGKNYQDGMNSLISGNQLLSIACDLVRQAQRIIGGKLAYLECKPVDKLIDFYNSNGFVQFVPDEDARDGKLIQWIKCV